MNQAQRDRFDRQLEQVIEALPERVRQVMHEVPLVVEDYPSRDMLRQLGLRHRSELCGLYTGVPLTERSIEQSGRPSDVVHLFRLGIMAEATDERGEIPDAALQREIRRTILHEYGHHHGLDEADLEELGY